MHTQVKKDFYGAPKIKTFILFFSCEYSTIAGVLKSIVIEAVSSAKSEGILAGFMPNGPKIFQTSIGASISGLISFAGDGCFFGASFFSAQTTLYGGLYYFSYTT